jgi:glycosyltransferase involved in cell wall biosynthesis
MLVSIVISAYNGQNTIERCVQTYLDQTYKDLEIILFDDASTDQTRYMMNELAKRFPDRIHVFCSDHNLGPGGGKEQGRLHANGKYVLFGDCDDLVEPDYVNNLVHTAEKNGYPDVVIGGIKIVTSTGDIVKATEYTDPYTALFQAISNCGKLLNVDFLNQSNLHLPQGRLLEDVLFQGSLIVRRPTVAVSSSSGYHYLQNEMSFSNTDLNHFTHGVLSLEMKYMKDDLKNLHDAEQRELFEYYAFRCVCWHLLKSGCGVPVEEMEREYLEAFSYLDQYFPTYRHSKWISWFRPKHERVVIRFVVGTVMMLHKMHLSRCFFRFYARAKFLKKFWPSM